MVVLLAGVALIVITVGFTRLRPWARIGGFVVEGLSTLTNIVRLGGARPGAAVVGLVVSLGVIAALLTPVAANAFATGRSVSRPPPSP